ncbi:hypothetical protein BH11ACT1_BH11ACT1_22220 [soil metagenome]
MSDLLLDTTALRQAGSSLRVVAQEFNDANAHSAGLSDAIGHSGLAGAVRGFAVSWDDRRAEMVDSIAALATACTGIGEGFENLDTQFAAALRGDQ